ncbi:MAG: 30S ribosomal protein S6 [Alphaproteobacteria bacterium]
MNNYETMFICRQDISTQQVDAIADKFQEIITTDKGKMGRRENWGLRTLAYRVKKNRKGHIVLFNYTAEHKTVKEVERRMGLSEDVIRYLTIRTTELETGESVGLKASSNS